MFGLGLEPRPTVRKRRTRVILLLGAAGKSSAEELKLIAGRGRSAHTNSGRLKGLKARDVTARGEAPGQNIHHEIFFAL